MVETIVKPERLRVVFRLQSAGIIKLDLEINVREKADVRIIYYEIKPVVLCVPAWGEILSGAPTNLPTPSTPSTQIMNVHASNCAYALAYLSPQYGHVSIST